MNRQSFGPPDAGVTVGAVYQGVNELNAWEESARRLSTPSRRGAAPI